MRLGRAGGALLGVVCLGSLGCDGQERAGPTPVRNSPPARAPAPLGDRGSIAIDPAKAGWRRTERLAVGATQPYTLPLARGDFLHLIVEQNGFDLVIRLIGPTGLRLLEVDRPRDERQPEELFFVAPADGRHRIEIASWDPEKEGLVEVRIAALRRATPADVRRSRALARFLAAWRLHREGGREGEVVAGYREAAALWRRVGDGVREAWALDQWGRLETAGPGLARLRQGMDKLERAAALYARSGQRTHQADALNKIGAARTRLRQLDLAARSYEQALAIEVALGNLPNQAARSNDLALARLREGRFAEAFDLYTRAIEINRGLTEHEALARVLFNRGVLFAAVGEPRRALDDHHEALALFEALFEARVETGGGDPSMYVAVLTKVGDDLLDLDRPEEALARYRAALALGRQAAGDGADESGVPVTLNSIGLAELALGRPESAIRSFEEAERLLGRLKQEPRRAVVLNNLGRAYERLGALDRARELYRQALAVASESPLQNIAENAWFGRARLARREGRLAEAELWALRALEASERLADRIDRFDLRASLLAARREPFEFLVDLQVERHLREPGAGHDARAFALHERSEARGLRELLAAGRRRLDPADAARLRILARRIDSGHRSLLRRKGGESLEPSAESRELGELLLQFLEVTGGAIAAGAPNPSPALLDLGAVQERLLDEETLLLEFHLGAERSILWAATRSIRRLVLLPSRETIERAASRVDRLLPESRFETREVAARQAVAGLSRMILAPVADLLGSRRLVVVASGGLGRVPFSALPHPRDQALDPAPLLVDHEVVQLPSVAVLMALRRMERHRSPAPHLLALVADPVFSAGDPRLGRSGLNEEKPRGAGVLGRLRYAGGEANAIQALAPPGSAFVATGLDASRALVESGSLADFRILHFATHGLYSEDFPELSALALSAFDGAGRPVDGLLRAYQVVGLDLRADLVVLSACKTALGGGDAAGGAGQRGLTEAFLRAGAPRVLVSLWDVDDRATGELMRRFYRGLLGGRLTPAQALRRAQLSLRRERRWRAPFYWAGFVLEGDWT